MGRGTVAAITGTTARPQPIPGWEKIYSPGHYADVKVVGNISIPYTQVADRDKGGHGDSRGIGSFQLETIGTFALRVGDFVHHTGSSGQASYHGKLHIAAKESITKKPETGDVCVLNYEDEVLREFGETLPFKVGIFFPVPGSWRKVYTCPGEEGLWRMDEEDVYIPCGQTPDPPGKHKYEGHHGGHRHQGQHGRTEEPAIVRGLRTFQAVEHRIE